MDLTRAVNYRGFALNTIRYDAVTRDMVGCEITAVRMGSVPGVGYNEKRALADGRDVSDVFLDQRVIDLEGVVYGRTRAEAYDQLAQLMDVLTPTDAYEASTTLRGYLPLDFYEPTRDTDFPTGLMHKMIFVRPSRTPDVRIISDVHGGQDDQALAFRWDAQLVARVPHIVNYDFTTVSMAGTYGAGNIVNRGNRPAVVEIKVRVPNAFNGSATGTVRLWISDTLSVRFIVKYSAYVQTYLYDTHDKILRYKKGQNDYAVRMDLLEYSDASNHRNLRPGSVAYNWRGVGTKPIASGSYFRIRDTFA